MARQAAGKAVSSGSVRIIAGTLRSRRLQFPARPGLRPTGDRVRETLFNWLQDRIAGARCLDLYAGSGALAMEAVSRGATFVDMVDSDHQVATSLRDSLAALEIVNAEVHRLAAEDFLARRSGQQQVYDIVFVDPPFADGHLLEICARLAASGALANGCRVYLESEQAIAEDTLPAAWHCLRSKKSGQVYYYLYESQEGADRQ